MKGIVFREFIDFVEDAAGDDITEDMIEQANPASGAAYTSVGKYDWREMVDLVVALSDITQTPVPDLLRAFGRHLFGRLSSAYPQFFEGQSDAFSILTTIEDQIHVEVLKLYPDAELPTLDVQLKQPGELSIVYTSCRPFGDLCVGMIEGCGDYFSEPLDVDHQPIEGGLNIRVRRKSAQAA